MASGRFEHRLIGHIGQIEDFTLFLIAQRWRDEEFKLSSTTVIRSPPILVLNLRQDPSDTCENYINSSLNITIHARR